MKWVGGKTLLCKQLLPLLPPDVQQRRHIEPFAGGAALFFQLAPARAILSDVNNQLIATYRRIQTAVELLIQDVRALERTHSVEQYYAIRKHYNETPHLADLSARCAEFIYLNKTGFNGLHRVNRRGEFNAPAGRPIGSTPRIVDALGLRAAHRALQGVGLRCGTFESVLDVADRGDFVYLDSPYDVEPGTRSFTAYAASPFGQAEHDLQAEIFRELDQRGCKLMLSNSATARNLARYAQFNITHVRAPRSISCRGAQRTAVTEIVVRNYT